MLRERDREKVREVLALAATRERYLDHVSTRAMSSGCRPWTGAVGGNGHGRFWVCSTNDGRDVVMSAHRVGYALLHGLDVVESADLVRHMCDEPICQNPEHWQLGSIRQNWLEYLARQAVPGSPLRDQRGALGRAIALRDAALRGDDLDKVALAGIPPTDKYQAPLF